MEALLLLQHRNSSWLKIIKPWLLLLVLSLLLPIGTITGFSVNNHHHHQQQQQQLDWLVSWRHKHNVLVSEKKKKESSSDQHDHYHQHLDFFFIRPCLPAEIGAAADILTEAFFKDDKTNWFTYQWERLTTHLSLESTFPNNNNNKPGDDDHHHRRHRRRRRRVLLVACHAKNGRVLGLAEIDDEIHFTKKNEHDTPRPYMFNVAVAPTWRRKGIASALVTACEHVARKSWGKSRVFLKVRDTSQAAINMYQSLGYIQECARVEKLNNKYQNLIVMSKNITTS